MTQYVDCRYADIYKCKYKYINIYKYITKLWLIKSPYNGKFSEQHKLKWLETLLQRTKCKMSFYFNQNRYYFTVNHRSPKYLK